MTLGVIDAPRGARCTRPMTKTARTAAPYDAVLRGVIRADALLSAALALIAFASPIVAIVPMTPAEARALGVGAMALAILLATLGAVTAVLLVIRMRAGHAHVPADLRLPLPAGMRPDVGPTASEGNRNR